MSPIDGVRSPGSAVQLVIGMHDIGAGIGERTTNINAVSGHIKELDLEYSNDVSNEPTNRI